MSTHISYQNILLGNESESILRCLFIQTLFFVVTINHWRFSFVGRLPVLMTDFERLLGEKKSIYFDVVDVI